MNIGLNNQIYNEIKDTKLQHLLYELIEYASVIPEFAQIIICYQSKKKGKWNQAEHLFTMYLLTAVIF